MGLLKRAVWTTHQLTLLMMEPALAKLHVLIAGRSTILIILNEEERDIIFYFTATGNGKYIAEKIAAATNDQIMNIASCVQNKQFSFMIGNGEMLGFVVPVYFRGIPTIVTEFLKKLKVSSKQDIYSYLVLNCGGAAGNADGIFNSAYKVKAVFGIAAVGNYVTMYKIKSELAINECLDKTEKAIEVAIQHIKTNYVGTFNPHKQRLPRLISLIGYPVYVFGRKTAKFSLNQSCTGCGLCEKICPRKAIQIKNGNPIWVPPQCELCFGCLHRCPASAINYGKNTAENGRYVNPRTRL